MMKKIAILALLPLLALLNGCGRGSNKPVERTYPVSLTDVTQKDVPVYIEAIGNVYSLQTVLIRPQVGGIIQEAYVKQGQYVKQGDPLYLIDPRPYQAALDRAIAALAKDTATLKYSVDQVDRYREAVEKNYVAKLTFDQYLSQVDFNKAQVESDKADIAVAKLNLEWTKPISPVTGKISQYDIDPGNLVVANDANALTDIRQITPADIRFNINQADFIDVQKALQRNGGHLKFQVILPQEVKTPREGDIYFIDNHIDQSTGTILVKGTVDNEDEFFWPGEFIHARLLLDVLPQAVLLPNEAVKIGQDGPFVYVYKPDTSTVELRKVEKGPEYDGLVVVTKGIELGDKVVLKGQDNLLPGVKVNVPEENKPK